MASSKTITSDGIDTRLILLSPADNIAAAATNLKAGDELTFDGRRFRVAGDVALGHKIAVKPIRAGEKVLKYGGPIGSATRDIAPGEHVHTHNLRSDYLPTVRDSH